MGLLRLGGIQTRLTYDAMKNTNPESSLLTTVLPG